MQVVYVRLEWEQRAFSKAAVAIARIDQSTRLGGQRPTHRARIHLRDLAFDLYRSTRRQAGRFRV